MDDKLNACTSSSGVQGMGKNEPLIRSVDFCLAPLCHFDHYGPQWFILIFEVTFAFSHVSNADGRFPKNKDVYLLFLPVSLSLIISGFEHRYQCWPLQFSAKLTAAHPECSLRCSGFYIIYEN